MRNMFAAALAALGFVASAPDAGRAAAEFEGLTYRAYIGGLPLGDLKLGIARDADAYRAEAEFRMVALLRWVLDTDARAQAVGSLEAGDPTPRSFTYWVRDRKERRTTEIVFDESGTPSALKADPPFREKSYGMTLEQAAGALDPATAAVAVSSARAEACDFSTDVFDGRKRHRISLTGQEGEAREDGRVDCTGLYERVAGFKAKHMTPERRSYPFRVSLKPLPDGRWRPVRVWAETQFGDAVVALVD